MLKTVIAKPLGTDSQLARPRSASIEPAYARTFVLRRKKTDSRVGLAKNRKNKTNYERSNAVMIPGCATKKSGFMTHQFVIFSHATLFMVSADEVRLYEFFISSVVTFFRKA